MMNLLKRTYTSAHSAALACDRNQGSSALYIHIASDGSGPKPGPGPARSPGFLESPRPDIGRRAQARARPEPVVKSPGAQRALGI